MQSKREIFIIVLEKLVIIIINILFMGDSKFTFMITLLVTATPIGKNSINHTY